MVASGFLRMVTFCEVVAVHPLASVTVSDTLYVCVPVPEAGLKVNDGFACAEVPAPPKFHE